MQPLVELCRITRSFPGVVALKDMSLALRSGSIHAIVGENGAGKSTLINVLSGVLPPDAGEIRVAGRPTAFADARAAHRHGIVAVHQEVDLFPDLTVAENIGHERGLPVRCLGWVDWSRLRRQTREALAAMGESWSPSLPAAALTPGRRQLVEIGAAVSQDAWVLILDEPTSSLSEAEAQLLFERLRRFRSRGSAILYVSHRLDEIFALADEVTVLRNGLRVWTGPVACTSPDQLIKQMVGQEIPAALSGDACGQGAVRLRCRALTAADGAFRDISLDVHGGEVFGLYGLVGAGRTEWAEAVFGLRGLAGGEIAIDGRPVTPAGAGAMIRRGVVYVPEDRLRHGLCRGLSVRANLVLASLRRLARTLWLPRAREVRQARQMVARLGVRLQSIEQPAGTLSGGNQQKVVLGRSLDCDPKVLLLDEPTRGVDVGAKAEIYGLVRQFAAEGRAVVFISSDLPEVLAQSNRVGVFREGRLVATFNPRRTSAAEVARSAIPAESGVQPLCDTDTAPRTERYLSRPALAAILRPALREGALLAVLIALFAFVEGRTGRFLQENELQDLSVSAALLGLVAIGTAPVILSGAIDISLGALMALSAGVAGRLWEQGHPSALAALVAVAVGGLGGMLNALLSLLGRVHPIVVTLGTLSLYRGLTLWWIEQDVQIPLSSRHQILGDVRGLPWITAAGIAVAVLTWLALNWTVVGRQVYAQGSNPSAGHRVGIHRSRVWLAAFTFQGLLVGLAGFLSLAHSGSLQPTSFDDQALQAIAAAVVGGVAITGGRGSVWGVVLGCLFLTTLTAAGVFLGVASYWQRTLVGGVIAVAVVTDVLWRRRGA